MRFFAQMKIGLGARILLNARGKVAAALGPRAGAAGIVHAVRVSQSPLAVLIALAALAFVATSMDAQADAATFERENAAAVPRQMEVDDYPEPVITCTVGRAGFIAQEGRQGATIERVVALGVAYVVLGGILFALVVSLRLLGEKVDLFFALLIPKPTGARGLRTIPPLDEDFSPFKFEPSAKQTASSLAPGWPPAASEPPKTSTPLLITITPPRSKPEWPTEVSNTPRIQFWAGEELEIGSDFEFAGLGEEDFKSHTKLS